MLILLTSMSRDSLQTCCFCWIVVNLVTTWIVELVSHVSSEGELSYSPGQRTMIHRPVGHANSTTE